MLAFLQNRPCASNELSLRHLEVKLKRYERRTQKPNAKHSDYIKLAEARPYLC